jgi:CelD/BcsL family acetyltransferase involved in cellulose biosynthesis
MNIAVLDSLPPELDALADAAPRATFYQTRVWLESFAVAYPRMALRCLVATEASTLRGYLPFFVSRRGPFRTCWSLPFGTYGGPVSDDGDVDRALLGAFRRELSRRNVIEAGWVDFHNGAPDSDAASETALTHIVDLRGGFDAVWNRGFDKPRRRRVRRAEEQGVEVRRARGEDDVHGFLDVYRQRLDAWNTGGGHPGELFLDLVRRGEGKRTALFVATHEGKVVGGHLNLYHRASVIAWYGMASARGDELNAGTLLYARCIRDACESGHTDYNLGASLGKRSLIEYKESLGGVEYRYRILRHRRLAGRIAGALRGLRAGR